ncbi:(2Fe-2S) ferredoxin domain-containing protein [Streptomyces sp. OF3]|uniref:(2Fe-2S) ferredoxin domain-containing protein n=1 Tax=Streptomyces alkaliterrae TaxID=2213162 RepID=A0A5P0YV09_9ACTN|nr:(2Fe-2S) ferredoxin domain-containing protein [Streptomyces alkaliterrae]MBB1256451.1 (2Fe-2S) ferredoxin domain-containing protein [Streptomyces alkaliterrae]MBB1257689.1 (2Fe-2S) ferredoxin domain-containing protein [Streptomyces alkaliterrae]MQS04124.1 (2Fe-2S) ferredoxin domain-containing protein [Streptomyces alkaliterrae]
MVLCRGCCCGTERKRPGVDHDGQLARVRAAADASGGRLTLLTTDCLGPCEHANVAVLRPSAAGRRRGGRAVWLGGVLTEEAVGALLEWADAGGPGLAPVPALLTEHVISPPKPT